MGKGVFAVVASFVALGISTTVIVGQSAIAPSGHWEGTLQVPGNELAIQVDLSGDGKTWEGTITIPAQNLTSFPLSGITVQDDTVAFAMRGVPGEPQFKGTVSKDGKSLSGDFTQGGGTIPFALTRTGDAKIEPLPKSTPITKDLEGSWEGALDVQGKVLRLALKLTSKPDGVGTGTLVSIDQGGAEIPIGAVIQTGPHLKLVVRAIAGTYEGDLKDGQLTGTWAQGPMTLPLVFTRPK
jgi:uncharacterized membrane protein